MVAVPMFIEKRLRCALPASAVASVIPGSIPVIAFGDPTVARIATVGINPSSLEFVSRAKKLLIGSSARFDCMHEGGHPALKMASPQVIASVYQSCCDYFKRETYYADWFDVLRPMLAAAGADYKNASACHLDLVQWATTTKWSDVKKPVQQDMFNADVPFLRQLLANGKYEVLMLNGRSVIRAFVEHLGVPWSCTEEFRFRDRTSEMCFGRSGSVKVVGWTLNPQSHKQGVKITPAELAPVATFVKQMLN